MSRIATLHSKYPEHTYASEERFNSAGDVVASPGLIRIPCGSCVATAGFCLARLACMSCVCVWPSWQLTS